MIQKVHISHCDTKEGRVIVFLSTNSKNNLSNGDGVDRELLELLENTTVCLSQGTSKVFLTLSEALASLVAEELKVRAARGLS